MNQWILPMVGERVFVNDVALRDGFQIEPVFVPTDDKVKLANGLARTGLHKIEVTSFTSAQAIPALRDAEAVMRQIQRVPGVTYVALVLNARGAERALACEVDEINLVVSASETHNLCNTRMTRAQSLQVLRAIVEQVRGKMAVNISVSTAFGCPMEGPVAPQEVLAIGDAFVSLGVNGITLCDTTGMANPAQVYQSCQGLRERWSKTAVTLHFHNTRGMGLANVLAGLAAGVRHFDASLGGLGGCPFAPGASGNICTEDLVHMLQNMGYDTGVDLSALLACARGLPSLVGHGVPGQLLMAGPSDRHYPVPADFNDTLTRAQERDAQSAGARA
ncbi:hydroxymethylglutaryl-CoA lyase [Ottowia caeni]|uniref:hydroxymethylglutaryl-CoA lyase n=1 Tax=Ottowia caeni TaxID=2870339 RepID=UPI001E3ECA1B